MIVTTTHCSFRLTLWDQHVIKEPIPVGEKKTTIIQFSSLQNYKTSSTSARRKCQKEGTKRIAQKVGEEALETVIEAVSGTNEKLVYEASDILYHLIVLLADKGLRIEDVAAELLKRHNPDWDKDRRMAKFNGTYKR